MEKPKELLRNIFEELTSLFEELYENQLYILYNFQWRISRPNFWSSRAFLKSSQESQRLGGKSSEVTSSRGEKAKFAFTNQETQDEIIQANHDTTGLWFGHAGLVFTQGNISAVIQSILDAPIGTD